MALGDLDIVVLAGGLGTRLRTVVSDRPKILAPVGNQPFLDLFLQFLHRQGARRVILALGYKAEMVQAHLESAAPEGLEIVFSVEPEPLGTGGALAYATRMVHSDPVLVMNGDTFVGADFNAFVHQAGKADAQLALLAIRVEEASRYGRLVLDHNDRVREFAEKGTATGPAWINGGIYLIHCQLLERFQDRSAWSLERDLLETLPAASIQAVKSRAAFIDIGTPESLAAAPAIIDAAQASLEPGS